ncbi:hypothetical protein B0H13DRAFT_1879319 [Mycena leptocephala]|nr:hypothetical protein B0H13DRAFT_1879319 [Mycena leptocephala]
MTLCTILMADVSAVWEDVSAAADTSAITGIFCRRKNPQSALSLTDLVRLAWDIITRMTKRNDVHMERVHIHDQIWSRMRRMRNLIGQLLCRGKYVFEEQEAEKGGRVDGRSGCGGFEVELQSSVNRKTWTAADAGGLKSSGSCVRCSIETEWKETTNGRCIPEIQNKLRK